MSAPWLWGYVSEQEPGKVVIDDNGKRFAIERITVGKGNLNGIELRLLEGDMPLSVIILRKDTMLKIECNYNPFATNYC